LLEFSEEKSAFAFLSEQLLNMNNIEILYL